MNGRDILIIPVLLLVALLLGCAVVGNSNPVPSRTDLPAPTVQPTLEVASVSLPQASASATPIVFPGNQKLPDRNGWLDFSGTGIGTRNQGLLDLHPGMPPPVFTFTYPSTWKRYDDVGDYSPDYPNYAWLNFKLDKHEPGVPESTGEAPGNSDAFIDFSLVLTNLKPGDYTSTEPFGYGAVDTVINYGTFNGQPAMFATLENDQYLHQSILFQVSHGILILIQVEFFMEGASEGYVTQTRSEINGILASLRAQ